MAQQKLLSERSEPPILPTGPRIDPYELYASMRLTGSVHLVAEPNGLHRWLILSYEGARAAMNDRRLSKDPAMAWEQLSKAGYVKGDRDNREDYLYHLVNTDPPDHTRLRNLVGKAFTLRRVEALRPRANEVARNLIAEMAPAGSADLVQSFSHPLSTTIICEILGVPVDDRQSFRLWATAMLTAPDMVTEGTMSPQEGYANMRAYFEELLQRKKASMDASPSEHQPDVLSGLIAARDRENKMTEVEVISTAMLLLSAGQEPTVNLINNGMLALFGNPEQRKLLQQKPELINPAVEEFLRYDPPVELSTMRVATEDIEIDGNTIPAGSVVTIAIAATSRDAAQFERPDELDIQRTSNPHLAFGYGIHRCLGAPLAQLEGQVGISALLTLLPDIELGCSVEELEWRPTRIMRGVVELPVRYTPRTL